MADQTIICAIEKAKYHCGISFPLKDKQVECIVNIVRKQDTVAVLPTGYGKSLCYTLLPIVMDFYHEKEIGFHTAIVVSPLVALMEEQVSMMCQYGLNAIYIGSSELTADDLSKLKQGLYQLVVLSPEVLFKEKWREILQLPAFRDHVHVMAVDEAHCVVQWGKEFRREYSQLGEIRSLLSTASILALTASAPPSMLPEIKKSLCMQPDSKDIFVSANRDNIFYVATKAPQQIPDTFYWLVEELRHYRQSTKKTIIYCRSIKACSLLFRYFLEELGDESYIGPKSSKNCLFNMFHHSTRQRTKSLIATMFPKEDSAIRVIIATVAFGMGIDCPDVYMVINWGASRSFEAFYQESGRGGRNPEMKAVSIVYYHMQDISEGSTDTHMRQYCLGQESNSSSDGSASKEHMGCRRRIISKYLTPNFPFQKAKQLHDCCDLCHQQCLCSECPDIPWINFNFLNDKDIVAADRSLDYKPVRYVSDENREEIRKALVEVRHKAVSDYHLFDGQIITGLDDDTISDVVGNIHHIHDVQDLKEFFLDKQQAVTVFEAICECLGQ